MCSQIAFSLMKLYAHKFKTRLFDVYQNSRPPSQQLALFLLLNIRYFMYNWLTTLTAREDTNKIAASISFGIWNDEWVAVFIICHSSEK